jgi:GDP-L-fucose synthase
MNKQARIFVSGHRGMVGSAIVRQLAAAGYAQVVTRTHAELDLRDQAAVRRFFATEPVDYVFAAAARVGGILANDTQRAAFIYDNLMIAANLVHGAHEAGIERLQFLGSSCIYPRDCPQPIKEEYLLTGSLEPTNEPYALAKIAGLKLCESYARQHGRRYFSVMPTNLYGPNDNYDLATSHVLPALLRKAHDAKLAGASELVVWGSGTPRREFLYVDDLAQACVQLMQMDYAGPMLNIGVGKDIPIAELAQRVMDTVGFEGRLVFDTSKPDGTPRKLLDTSRAQALGIVARTSLADGLHKAYLSAPFHPSNGARDGGTSP